MTTPGSVVVWERLSLSAHWLAYDPRVSNYIETVRSQWKARGGATAWPNQNIVYLNNVSSSLALFAIELNTLSENNQSTGTKQLLFFILLHIISPYSGIMYYYGA